MRGVIFRGKQGFNPKELHCDSPTEACQKFEAASLSATDRTYGSARTYGPSGRTACMAAWTFPCSGCHSKLEVFLGHFINEL